MGAGGGLQGGGGGLGGGEKGGKNVFLILSAASQVKLLLPEFHRADG